MFFDSGGPRRWGWSLYTCIMSNLVKIAQLNCHNAYQTHTELSLLMSKEKNIISLLQEPYVNGKKIISNCPAGFDIFPGDRTNHKRKAIFASRHLKLTKINELCTNFVTAVGGIIEGNKIIFASVYMHHEAEIISQGLKNLIMYAKGHGF